MNREQMELIVEVKKELMAKRGKLLDILDSDKVAKIQVEIESRELKSKINALDSLLESANALLNAGEVFGESLGKADEDIPDDKEEAYRLGSKDTRSEDTAILARKMMGLEEVIYKARQEWEKLCGEWSEDKPRPMPFDKYLTQIITQHLKGAK